MSAVATETICFGLTSISCTSSGGTDAMSVVAPKKLSASSILREVFEAGGLRAAAHEDARRP